MKITKAKWFSRPREMSYMLDRSHMRVINSPADGFVLCRCGASGNTAGGLFIIEIEDGWDNSLRSVNETFLRKLVEMVK